MDAKIFNCKNLCFQRFPLSKKFMEYLVEFANAKIMQKFHRSCKYFYVEAPYFIVDTLEFGYPNRRIENIEYDGCLDFMDENEFETFLPKINNIWIIKKLEISACGFELIDKIVRCDASEVLIPGSEISFEKFEILTKSKNVEKLFIGRVHSNGIGLQLENILALVPNVSYIVYCGKCFVTPQTMIKLNEIPWKQKIKYFCFYNIIGEIDVDLFFNFVMNCMDPNAVINIQFSDKKNEAFKKAYNLMVDKSTQKLPKFKSFYDSFKRTRMSRKQSTVTFTIQSMIQQKFFLPYSMMNYIRENSNGIIMAKLYRTCKIFYYKNPFCIIQSLGYLNEYRENYLEFIVNNHQFSIEVDLLKMLDNIWISNQVYLNCYEPKEFLNKIVRCDAEDVRIFFNTYNPPEFSPLTLNDYKFLTKSTKKFDFTCEKISGADGKLISVQELLEFLPNAKSISAMVQGITRQQQQQLSTSKVLPPRRKFIIEKLDLEFYYESTNIDAHTFWKLIKKALAPKSQIYLKFYRLTDHTFLPEFKREMKAKIETWRPRNEKPSFTCN